MKQLPRSPKKLHCPIHETLAVVNQSLKPYGKVLICPSLDCNGRLVDENEGQEKRYLCPVPNCTEPINNNRKKLSSHLNNNSHHTAT